VIFVPPIGLWILTAAMGARRHEEEIERLKKRDKSIDMGAPYISRKKKMRMCIKAQSDNPCHSALTCGHGEPHICEGNDCLEPGHWCVTLRSKKEGA